MVNIQQCLTDSYGNLLHAPRDHLLVNSRHHAVRNARLNVGQWVAPSGDFTRELPRTYCWQSCLISQCSTKWKILYPNPVSGTSQITLVFSRSKACRFKKLVKILSRPNPVLRQTDRQTDRQATWAKNIVAVLAEQSAYFRLFVNAIRSR